MPTRNVVLTEHQSALIDRLVAEGRYQNASEAMREGLRLVEEREDARHRLSTYLDDLIGYADGLSDEDYIPVDEAFARLRAKTPPAE